MSESSAIEIRCSGVRAHNSLGIGRRHHGPLRCCYNKINTDFEHVEENLLLKIAVKTMNDTIGESGFVSSQLVVFVTPRLPTLSKKLSKQKERENNVSKAQMEMISIVAERKVEAALQKSIPHHADNSFPIANKAFVSLEKHDKQIVTFILTQIDG